MQNQDPWIVLTILRSYFSSFSSNHPILPILSSPCGNDSCPKIIGDIEFASRTDDRRKYSKNHQICGQCGHGGVPAVVGLPNYFYTRLIGSERTGAFDLINIPRFDGYRATSYIQHNLKKKHFRTINTSSSGITVLDGNEEVKRKHEDLNDLLY